MKIIYNISRLRLLIAFLGLMTFYSCSKDYPSNIESSNATVLKTIKIINAGADGKLVIEGVVNEDKKTISFPRIDPETDFSAIRFEAEVSQGANLDKESYEFPFQEGESEKTIIIKAENKPRYREYLVTIRLRVPVFGADFKNGNTYDFSNNPLGNPIYETFTGLATRGAAFDGENVLILSRFGSTNPHLLKVSDLKEGKIIKHNVNTTGISGGTLPINTGALVNGNMYVSNISGTLPINPLRLYYYPDYLNSYNSTPQVISFSGAEQGIGSFARFGDNISYNLDDQGNGDIVSVNNGAAPNNILRIKIANFTQITDAKLLPRPAPLLFNASFNRIGQSAEYILKSYDAPLRVVDENGVVLYTDNATNPVFPLNGSDARVITFNSERYLIMTTVARPASPETVFQVYNITRGNGIIEALGLFALGSETDRQPVFKYSLDNANVNAAAITQTAWRVVKDSEGKDETLQLFTASADSGFVIFEFPISTLED